MPIKKKFPVAETPTKPPAPQKKVAAKKATPAPTASPKIAPKKTASPKKHNFVAEISADPATHPGAHEKAASVLGQVWKVAVQFSSGGKNSFWFRFQAATVKGANDWVWRQCGASVLFETPSGDARYVGRLNQEEASGTGGNDTGVSWTWTAERSDESNKGILVVLDPAYQPPR